MRSIPRLLCALLSALVLISCKESTSPNTEVQFENKVILQATIDGSSVVPLALTSEGSETSGLVSVNIGGTATSGTLTLILNVTGTGSYILGDGGTAGSFRFNKMITPIDFTEYITGDGALITVIVDKIDKSNKRVKGRFSGTIKSDTHAVYEVKDGKFEGTW